MRGVGGGKGRDKVVERERDTERGTESDAIMLYGVEEGQDEAGHGACQHHLNRILAQRDEDAQDAATDEARDPRRSLVWRHGHRI
eukprot:COSAG03_NODE_3488_length_1986_cov_1.314255_1_plen_85_part_00